MLDVRRFRHEPGKSVEGATWVGREDAEQEIHESWQRFKAAATH